MMKENLSSPLEDAAAFGTEAPPTWETCKENVAPLKRGRATEKIDRAFGASKKGEDADIRSRFEDALLSQDHDPLAVWVKYAAWLEDRYPLDREQAFLVRERCVRRLKDEERYRNDIRYIQTWIDYIHCLEIPLEAFKFMQMKGIGLEVADFWLAWAGVAEELGKRRLATQIYVKAIESLRNPDPLLFKRQEQLAQAPPEPVRSRPRSNRQVLASTRRQASRRQQNPQSQPAAATSNEESQGAAFVVFVDETLREIDDLAEASDDDWPDFATSASRAKENSLPPAPWTLSKIGHLPARPALRATAPVPEIYIDKDDDDDPSLSPSLSPTKKEEAASPDKLEDGHP